MSIYAISDLHLSFDTDKPMNKFGSVWEQYEEKMKYNWNKVVEKNDLVLIAGDVSWATYVQNASKDFAFINDLNGVKLISKGNHDYWWETLNKLNGFLSDEKFDSIHFLHNNCFEYGDYVICGTKGYDFSIEEKYRERELIRFELSLSEGLKTGKEIIAMLHYPPYDKDGVNPEFMNLLEKYEVKTCIFGHIHSKALQNNANKTVNNTDFILTSCDFLDFSPALIRNT